MADKRRAMGVSTPSQGGAVLPFSWGKPEKTPERIPVKPKDEKKKEEKTR